MDIQITTYDELGSTNTIVKDQIKRGCPEGFVCRAARQTNGYGRQGRSWVSGQGGSYQSILLRPSRSHEEWPTLALVTGLAVRHALLDLCEAPDDDIFVKWPNDVMTKSGKLVGISCEACGSTPHEGVCIGIGVNVVRSGAALELGDKNTAAYMTDLLDDCPCDDVRLIEVVSDAVVCDVADYYETWVRDGFKVFRNEYCQAHGFFGRTIRLLLLDGGILASGRVIDVNETGQLVVEEDDGTTRAFSSGEVHLL